MSGVATVTAYSFGTSIRPANANFAESLLVLYAKWDNFPRINLGSMTCMGMSKNGVRLR